MPKHKDMLEMLISAMSNCFTDLQVVAGSQDVLQCTNTVREDDCKLVDMDPAFKIPTN